MEKTHGLRREPELPEHVDVAAKAPEPKPRNEFTMLQDETPEDAARQRQMLRRQMQGVVRQASLDPADDLGM